AARALPAKAVRQDEDEEDDPRARMARGKPRRFEDDEDDADEGRMRKPKRRGVLPAPLGLRITVIVLAILAGLASAGLGVAGILAKAKETEDVDQNPHGIFKTAAGQFLAAEDALIVIKRERMGFIMMVANAAIAGVA